jgi:DNA-binding CsgD family transcriptional regulator/tetratricopeptide (TPR) repeat protein
MHPVSPAGVLAGRAHELALLDGLLRDLARGSGGAVLIEGEPGIGKTALMRAALAAAPTGSCQVFWGAGDELGQELPLQPFLDALGVRRPSANARRATIAGLLRGEVATDRGADVPAILAEQLIALTIDETAARPVALIIDDLQWADPASVKLWGRLARTARDVPLLLAGMTRPVPQRHDLLALRRGDERVRVQLAALAQPAVAELVAALAGGRPDDGLLRLARGAGGNPLYLTELIAALGRSGGVTVTASGSALLAAATVPDSLPAAIADRVGFVSAPTKDVLRAAALLGVEFAVSDLTTVLGKTVAALVPALDEARATGVLADAAVGGGLAFRHPLIREALYAEVPAAVRGVWHRDAGYALASAGAPPDRVARQLLHAIGDGARVGEPGRGPAVEIERPPVGTNATPSGAVAPIDQWMLDWLTGSADSLVGQAPGVAAELLGQAVAGSPKGSDRHGWLAGRLADALFRTGDTEEAVRAAERALGYANDPDLIVDLHWTLAQCRMVAGSARESFAALDRALAAPAITPKHRGRLLVLAARTYVFLGDFEASGREATSALAAATEAGDVWATAWALHVLALSAAYRGDLTEALPLYDRAVAVTETDPALYDLGLLLQVNKAGMLFNIDRCDEALATAERARQLADQVGTAHRLAQAHCMLGQVLHEIGRWDDALTEIAAVPWDLKEPPAACQELGISAQILFHRNEAGAARRYLADAERYAERLGQRLVPALALALSLEREQAQAPAEALRILTAAFSDNPDGVEDNEDLFLDAVRLAVKTADQATARTLTGQAETLAAESQIPHRRATALYCRGIVDRDASMLLAAAQRYADAGRPLPRAKALAAAAAALVAADDRTGARLAFEQALEVYESVAAEADLNRLQAEFRAHGIRRGPHSKHRRATSGWDSLTGTELKIAAFVEEGLSNPEIANRLMLSRRTVATHVSHILKKLDVATRTDIARESALRATAGAR